MEERASRDLRPSPCRMRAAIEAAAAIRHQRAQIAANGILADAEFIGERSRDNGLAFPQPRRDLVGGLADPIVGGCVDAAAGRMVMGMRLDQAFLGVCAVSAKFGIGAFYFADAIFKRAIVKVSRHTVVMATAEKLAEQVPYQAAVLGKLTFLSSRRRLRPNSIAT